MNNGISSAGSIMNSALVQQTQQQVQETQETKQAETEQVQNVATPAESTINDLDLTIAYEVKLAEPANETYTQPQPTEAKPEGGAPPPADGGSGSAAAEETTATTTTSTASAAQSTGTATVSTDPPGSGSADLTSLTEQQMQKLVSEGSITRSQMLDELDRRNGGGTKGEGAQSAAPPENNS